MAGEAGEGGDVAPPPAIGLLFVGSLNMDVFNYVERFPNPGETLTGTAHHTASGGKGANQAVMAAKMSRDPAARGELSPHVAMLGSVGDDAFGKRLCQSLHDAGVDTALVALHPTSPTGVATITVDAQGENTIILFPGANYALDAAAIAAQRAAFEASRVVVCQNEVPLDATRAALCMARELGKITVFNPAPATAALAADSMLLAAVDVLVPNETETALLLGKSFQGPQPLSIEDSAAELLDRLKVKALILTVGKRGAYVLSAKAGSHGVWVAPPPLESPVVDTTGAGDAFIGALAWKLAQASDWDSIEQLCSATRLACAAAAVSVQSKGCQASYGGLDDAQRALARASTL